MAPSGYEYVMVKSTQSVQWSGFSGQIPFTWKTPNNKWCSGKDCYMAVKPRIIYNDGTNQLPIKKIDNVGIPYIVKNPCSVLFTTGKCLINDKLVSNMNELSSTNTLYKSIYDTITMQQSVDSTCPIYCQSIAEDRATYASKCQLMFNKVNEQTLNWALPFPIFQSSKLIPPHTKIELDFQVNSNFIHEFISMYGKLPAGGIVPLTSLGTNPTANSIGIGIDDITIWAYYITMPPVENIPYDIPIRQFFSQIKTLNSTNESFSLTLPNGGRNVTHLLCCFLQTKRGTATALGSIKASSNDFSSGYSGATGGATGEGSAYETKITNDAVTNLVSIRFTAGNKNFPNPDYTLDLSVPDTPTNNVTYDSKDLARAFYDTVNNSSSKFDRSGNMFSIQNFYREPMFCFRLNEDPTSYSETLQVNIGLGSGYIAGTSQLLTVALYDETVRLHFDSEKITLVELIS